MATTPDSQAEDRARNGALLLSAPVIAQPALVVASMLWARQESILLHPDNAAVNPPTVSRAIADPAIGDIFADLMLPAFVLLLFALWRIGAALYRPRHSRPMKALWTAFLLCEATAACGMVVLSQYTAFYSDDLHLLGSYMLFFGHGFGIALWGIFISFDRRSGEWDIPRPYSAHLQARLALAIAAASIVYGVLYFDWDMFESWDNYLWRVIFSMFELALIASFEIYLASFAIPLFRYERYRLLNRSHLALVRERMVSP